MMPGFPSIYEPPKPKSYRVVLSAIAYFAVDVTAANFGEARSKALTIPRALCAGCLASGLSISREFEVDYAEVLPAPIQDQLPGVDDTEPNVEIEAEVSEA
jgi:hypothetical protein